MGKLMTDADKLPFLDFDSIEFQQNQTNLNDMKKEIEGRSGRLTTRISHFASQFGLPEDTYWADLEANPSGPLASVLAREARRQNIHESAAAEFIKSLKYVSDFRKLPSTGPNASYLNSDGQIITKAQLGNAVRPSKSIDFQWTTASITCYAAQKYTKVGGGIRIISSMKLSDYCKIFCFVLIMTQRSLYWQMDIITRGIN